MGFPTGDYDASAFSFGLSWTTEPVELALAYPRGKLGNEGLSGDVAQVRTTRLAVVNKFAIPPSSARKRSGAALDTTLSLAGVELAQPIVEHLSLTARAFGAWDGDVGGFSQGLLGARGEFPVPSARKHTLFVSGEVGAAGGGNVDIDGGLMFSISAGWRYALGRHLFLQAEVGSEQASRGSYEAETVTIGLGWELPRAYLR
jgi:hypothetical protein